ncbi:MAG: CCA tRNA nucleotidyltransferase [Planctomycetota bacterium]|nr:MAG: CCA tRNA nucleotidyltransferase [Planctomycetota bacterium]REJ95667.1 MAG: CCA tRNA nucleotidyltransferase [Planctomycetota bacterium]REK29178.1 MAG: CCA tRNA nucleotidyltransferase [Planctomycetota bacterium]REK46968.1 MAG: CCA tRNA nucleotidyltransferase [Planctomycetota bacterium]
MTQLDPTAQRDFAHEVTRRLQEAGYESYWAGGCVRDRLLERVPSDYDVATSARPEQIRKLFGKHRTLAIGAAFGVITVLGPKVAGPIEVASFRVDEAYSDGRRPDGIRYSTAREDALRRDFTINGMFYNPVTDEVIDFVSGREDLKRGVVRAIGDANDRFDEDKLRMLRAVRFAATFDFELEAATREAIARRPEQLSIVSAERVGVEMRRMLVHPRRAKAIELMRSTGLLPVVVPHAVAELDDEHWRETLALLDALERPSFPTALAALLLDTGKPELVGEVNRHWRLANKEVGRSEWLMTHAEVLAAAAEQPWSRVQRILIQEGIDDLVTLLAARVSLGTFAAADLQFVRERLAWSAERLDPSPLISGDDLVERGLQPGKAFRELLEAVRDAQLNGQIATAEEALALVDRLRDPRG